MKLNLRLWIPSDKLFQKLEYVVTIRLRAHPQAPLERVLLRTCPNGEQSFAETQPSDVSAVCRWGKRA